VPFVETKLADLPDDSESLRAMVRLLLVERDDQRQRAQEQQQRAEELHVENLRLQLELERYKKWYYGPRADRLRSSGDLAQQPGPTSLCRDQCRGRCVRWPAFR
jgi:hypothetical protein